MKPMPAILSRTIPLALPLLCLLGGMDAHAADAGGSISFTVERFVVDGHNPLSRGATERVLAPYRGVHHDLASLQKAADALQAALTREGYGLYEVTLPPQEVEHVVHLSLVPRHVGAVGVVDATSRKPLEGTSATAIRRALPRLKEHATPNVYHLAGDIAHANENGSRQLAVRFSRAGEPGVVDASIEVQRASHFSATLQADNTGTAMPGRQRLSAYLTDENLFDRDITFTAAYTVAPGKGDAIRNHGYFLRAPVYALGGSLTGYWFHSKSQSGRVASFFDLGGAGRFSGVAWAQHLPSWGGLKLQASVSLDNRLFVDGTTFFGYPIGHDVRTRPLGVGFSAHYERARSGGNLAITSVHNIARGTHNIDADYDHVRSGAHDNWSAWRATADASWQLPHGNALTLKASGQYARMPLVAGEGFGVGGSDAMRALEMREILGDSGMELTAELWSPQLVRGLRLVAYGEAAHVVRHEPTPGMPASDSGADAGLGVRWQFARTGALSLDYARLVNGFQTEPTGHGRLYASLAYKL